MSVVFAYHCIHFYCANTIMSIDKLYSSIRIALMTANDAGDDFAIGDLHGEYGNLMHLLESVGFNVHLKVKSTGFQPVSFSRAGRFCDESPTHAKAGVSAGPHVSPTFSRRGPEPHPTVFRRWLLSASRERASRPYILHAIVDIGQVSS